MSAIAQYLRRRYRSIPTDAEGRLLPGKWLMRGLLRFLGWFLVVSALMVGLYAVVPIPVTPLMLIRTAQQAADPERSVRLYKDWVPLSDISNHLQLAVVCAEDQRFLQHNGFDFEAIEKAHTHNQRSRRKRGASTISQQTAKNAFLWPARSWLRKGLEVYFTAAVELLWSKQRIMTQYLNIIEFGDGIYGAEAASRHFFLKSAKNLTKEEAAMLAAVMPAPLRYSPSQPTPYIRQRQQWILRQMRAWGNKLSYDQVGVPLRKD
jgi:monofunctional biosynthetic peptidoglycan transglycosylase